MYNQTCLIDTTGVTHIAIGRPAYDDGKALTVCQVTTKPLHLYNLFKDISLKVIPHNSIVTCGACIAYIF